MCKYILLLPLIFILVSCNQEKDKYYDAIYNVDILLYDYDLPIGKATVTQYAHYKNDDIEYSRITLTVKNIYHLPTSYNFKIVSSSIGYMDSVTYLNPNSFVDFGTINLTSKTPITIEGFHGIIYSDVYYGVFNG